MSASVVWQGAFVKDGETMPKWLKSRKVTKLIPETVILNIVI